MTSSASTSTSASRFKKTENRHCTNPACDYLEIQASFYSDETHLCVKCRAPTEFRRISKVVHVSPLVSHSAPDVVGMCDVEVEPGVFLSRAEWNAKVAQTEREKPGHTLVRVDEHFKKLQYEERMHENLKEHRRHGYTEAMLNARDERNRAAARERVNRRSR